MDLSHAAVPFAIGLTGAIWKGLKFRWNQRRLLKNPELQLRANERRARAEQASHARYMTFYRAGQRFKRLTRSGRVE